MTKRWETYQDRQKHYYRNKMKKTWDTYAHFYGWKGEPNWKQIIGHIDAQLQCNVKGGYEYLRLSALLDKYKFYAKRTRMEEARYDRVK